MSLRPSDGDQNTQREEPQAADGSLNSRRFETTVRGTSPSKWGGKEKGPTDHSVEEWSVVPPGSLTAACAFRLQRRNREDSC